MPSHTAQLEESDSSLVAAHPRRTPPHHLLKNLLSPPTCGRRPPKTHTKNTHELSAAPMKAPRKRAEAAATITHRSQLELCQVLQHIAPLCSHLQLICVQLAALVCGQLPVKALSRQHGRQGGLEGDLS